MPIMPWRASAQVLPDRDYEILLSYLPLKRMRSLPLLADSIAEVRRQLSEAPGLVGYSIRQNLLGGRLWTLSAWTDDRALRRFAATTPHREVMRRLAPHIGVPRFVRWTLPGSSLPPTWNDALHR
jgi:hypothetical protein